MRRNPTGSAWRWRLPNRSSTDTMLPSHAAVIPARIATPCRRKRPAATRTCWTRSPVPSPSSAYETPTVPQNATPRSASNAVHTDSGSWPSGTQMSAPSATGQTNSAASTRRTSGPRRPVYASTNAKKHTDSGRMAVVLSFSNPRCSRPVVWCVPTCATAHSATNPTIPASQPVSARSRLRQAAYPTPPARPPTATSRLSANSGTVQLFCMMGNIGGRPLRGPAADRTALLTSAARRSGAVLPDNLSLTNALGPCHRSCPHGRSVRRARRLAGGRVGSEPAARRPMAFCGAAGRAITTPMPGAAPTPGA